MASLWSTEPRIKLTDGKPYKVFIFEGLWIDAKGKEKQRKVFQSIPQAIVWAEEHGVERPPYEPSKKRDLQEPRDQTTPAKRKQVEQAEVTPVKTVAEQCVECKMLLSKNI